MISENLNKSLNTQINKEFYSAYLYLSMAHFFNEKGLTGFSNWLTKQAQEEVSHGMDIFNFLTSINAKIEFIQINQPEKTFSTIVDTIRDVLYHERHITEAIKTIAISAHEENAFTTKHFLDKMLNEQIEEEEYVYKLYTKLKMFGECKGAIYQIDKDLETV